MIANPVTYEKKIKDKVDSYNKLKKEEKFGSYWDNEKDKELSNVKKHIKDYYIKVQNYTCPYCQQKIVIKHNGVWDAEHIIPKDEYPQFLLEPKNLCVSCKDCNQEKKNKNVLVNPNRKTFPTKNTDYKLSHPHFDDYFSNIKILKSSLCFIPLNEKGKKTIEICGLLRFLYKFTNYGNIPLEIKTKIGSFQTELMSTNEPIQEHFILSCIEDLVQKGKKLAKEKALNSK